MMPKFKKGDVLVHKSNGIVGKITVVASDNNHYIVKSQGEIYRFSHKHLEHEWVKEEE